MDTLALPFSFKSIDDAGHIEGLAAAFGNVDRGGDKIIPGAFAKSLTERAGRPVTMLLHHDPHRPAGVWTELRETPEGLYGKGRFTLASRDGAEGHALAKDGALSGLSIGYEVGRKAHNADVRELHEVKLHEVSLVAFPMNERTQVRHVKMIAGVRDIEDLFAEGGMSGRKAKAAASAAWKAINETEDEAAVSPELAALFKQSAARIAAGR